jgi:hypothetical protein
VAELQRAGKLTSIPPLLAPQQAGLQWPLRTVASYSDPDYHGISNFVDLDATYPNHLLDWNCQARTYDQANPVRVGAFPTYANPFLWRGVVETRNFFALANVDSATPEVDPGEHMEILSKPEETSVTLAAKQSYLGRVYLDWAKFPIIETSPAEDGGYLVRFYDLRFGPAEPGARRPLSAAVLLDRNLRVVKEVMGGAPQPAPD